MSTTPVKRAPRRPAPQSRTGSVVLQPPPELPRGGGEGHWTLNLLPMVAGLGSVVFFFVPGANALMMVVGALTFASSLVFGAVTAVRQRNGGKGKVADARRDYLRHLAQARAEVVAAARAQKEAACYANPDPDRLWSLVALRERLWERRPADPDFLAVRIGRGQARLATQLVPPDTAPMSELEPMCADALRRLLAVRSTLPDQPVAISLRSMTRLIAGGEPAPAALRALVAQLVTFHSPDDLRICVIADGDRIPRWDWLKWLPHTQHPSAQDAAGPKRMIFDDPADAAEGLEPLLAERPRFTAGITLIDRPHVIVIVDTATARSQDPTSRPWLSDDGLLGMTVLELAAESDARPRPKRHQMALRIAENRTATLEVPDGRGGPDEHPFPIRIDTLRTAQVEGLARQLAPLRPAAGGGDEPLLSALEFTDLLGLGDAAEIDPPSLWQRSASAPNDRLRVPIGVGEDGQPVVLDLKEAALGGMGPHGLCVGATGSGKSELLRSLVAALALTHSSEQVNFILADFKGGATFAGLAGLPHVAAVITNLADDLTLVDRMRDALTGELNRRQELLKRAGNVKNVHDYEKARAAGPDLAALPSLLVVVDEFSEMLTARPEFIDTFLQIGRIGRSLGVHLLLASQRLEEGRLRGLDTYLSYRLGLKTFSAAESRAVLGVADAHNLPSVPGSGYLKYDSESMTRFKAAYVSGAYGRAKALAVPAARSAQHRRPVRFTALHQAPVLTLYGDPAEPDLSDSTSLVALDAAAAYRKSSASVLDVIVDRLSGFGPPAHRVWLPPLEESPTLDDLLPGIAVTEDRGLSATRWPGTGRLAVPVGIVDKPAEQRQDPQMLDLSGAGGHVLVAGGPRAGKSTVLQTLMFALALTHTPREIRFLVVDLGGGTLGPLATLPHVSAVAARSNPDLVRRIVAEAVGILDRRGRRRHRPARPRIRSAPAGVHGPVGGRAGAVEGRHGDAAGAAAGRSDGVGDGSAHGGGGTAGRAGARRDAAEGAYPRRPGRRAGRGVGGGDREGVAGDAGAAGTHAAREGRVRRHADPRSAAATPGTAGRRRAGRDRGDRADAGDRGLRGRAALRGVRGGRVRQVELSATGRDRAGGGGRRRAAGGAVHGRRLPQEPDGGGAGEVQRGVRRRRAAGVVDADAAGRGAAGPVAGAGRDGRAVADAELADRQGRVRVRGRLRPGGLADRESAGTVGGIATVCS
ncbi:MAG: type VII secretion protein EccCa [Catenulispora sp. 13_1_20CM_3_70_7]|nr:MAG: type VII secretion protein EccCa [Catenulispora sp. 13_1_20CM_3_70_7]